MMRNRARRQFRILLFSVLGLAQIAILPQPALALAATGDGNFTLTDAKSNPESADSASITVHFPTTDSLGLPSFPASAATSTCIQSHSYGVAVTFIVTRLKCSRHLVDKANQNGKADRARVDGYILIPPGATKITVRADNRHPATSGGRTGVLHMFSAPGDDRTELSLGESSIGTTTAYAKADSVEFFVANPECATSPAMAYRLYIYDKRTGMHARLRWKVVGGSKDTSGLFVQIPRNNLSSLAGYDNDLDNNNIADYKEADTDSDTVSDWLEMGQASLGATTDTDGDGSPDCADTDSDNDGSTDQNDPNPLTPTATPDTIAATAPDVINLDLTDNDTEFAGSNKAVTDLGTGSATGYTLSSTGTLHWDTTSATPGAHTINYRICNQDASTTACATSSATITIDQQADLATTIAYGPTPPSPGQTTTITATATNNGPTNSTNTTLTLTAPTNTTFPNANIPASCTLNNPTTVTCSHPGTAGQSNDYALDVLVDPNSVSNATLDSGSATANNDINDPDPTNNTTPIEIVTGPTITDFAPLAVNGATTPLSPATASVLLLDLTNNGPSTAPTEPAVTVTLSSQLMIDQTAPNPDHCSIATPGPPQTITCNPTTSLGPGDTHQLQLPLIATLDVACLFAIDPTATLNIGATLHQLSADPTDPGTTQVNLAIAAGDNDADGIPDHTEIGPDCSNPLDSDNDGTPDYQDADGAPQPEPEPQPEPDAGATITGRVFLDANLDGLRQDDEDDISNVVVRLESPGTDEVFDTIDDLISAQTVTRSPYTFEGISDGAYRVVIDQATLPYAIYATRYPETAFNVVDGVPSIEIVPNFGQFYASVSGQLTDLSDAPLANIQISVIDADGNQYVATTDELGRYFLQGGASTPLVRGEATVTATINGTPAAIRIQILGTQTARADLHPRPALLPITGGFGTPLLLGGGTFFIVSGTFLDRVSARRRTAQMMTGEGKH